MRDHDIVVYGATGFVGKLTAEYLARTAPEGAGIAIGGRSRARLEQTRAGLGPRAAEWPILVADSADVDAVGALAASTRVVATTVGPYAKYGVPLVQACAAHGTHYADLTGEVLFMRTAIDTADAPAKATGARIVPTCGFDSIPSDLGVFLLAEHAHEHGLGDLKDTTLVVVKLRGGPSGGTIDTLRTTVDTVKADRAVLRTLRDPYALSPDRAAEPDLGAERDPVGAIHDEELGGWFAPFVMGTVNSRVVRRSNALLGHAYGHSMRYRELMATGSGPAGAARAAAIAGGLGAVVAGFALPGARQLLDRLLPDPGQGPSEAARDKGFFHIDVHTRTSTGARLVCEIRASGDPGYKATAVMLGESALALSLDEDQLPAAAGVLTPATALGHVLAERLRAAGHRYDVVAR